ncbi:MAG: class I SAM-dependent methyltransferase [Bacteroidota bacterium]|nr:class I SAM-dependent methyltransferase [Bacteroidota bacterium]
MINDARPEFDEYKLIDCGNGYKLEQFGKYTLLRPEPQAIWNSNLSENELKSKADAIFTRDKSQPEKGNWELKTNMNPNWKINYKLDSQLLTFRLGLTGFKHIGLFPEQAHNWKYIFNNSKEIQRNSNQTPNLLNLFAYTGGASLAAAAGGANVIHVDSVRNVVTWANENSSLSNLNNIRWVVEDAMKFVKRELKRGHQYDGIILDPPAYGRGPEGEKWHLEEQINELIGICSKLLKRTNSFIVLNLYSMGYSPIITETLLQSHFKNFKEIESGELYFTDSFNKKLPLGIYCRLNY